MKKKFLLVMLAFIAYPSFVAASTSLSKGKDTNENNTLSIHFDNKEAKEIFKHLEYAQNLEGYVVSSGAAGSGYLSSPAITCRKIASDTLNDDSPNLYSCDVTIGANALIKND